MDGTGAMDRYGLGGSHSHIEVDAMTDPWMVVGIYLSGGILVAVVVTLIVALV